MSPPLGHVAQSVASPTADTGVLSLMPAGPIVRGD